MRIRPRKTMNRYTTVLSSLGATLRPGTDESALARAEALQGIRFPEEVREFYRATDGLVIEDLDLEIFPLSFFSPIAGPLNEGHGYAHFTELNDSNPYSICCAGPLFGFVVHLYHDDESVLVCRSLGRFLDIIVEKLRQFLAVDEEQRVSAIGDLLDPGIDRLEEELDLAFNRPERTADDARIGNELIRYADEFTPRDGERGDALRFAAQMFGPGHEADLARVLAAGDEYVRDAVLKRCRVLNTPAARALLEGDSQDFNEFIEELAKAIVAAGMEVRRHPPPGYGFSIEPGNVGLNFQMLYCRRHESGWLPGLLQRIPRWQSEKIERSLGKLVRSGVIQSWVESQRGEWDHAAWLNFLRRETASCGPLPADRVGLLLEEEKRRYWARKT
jgi:hypothetical protein